MAKRLKIEGKKKKEKWNILNLKDEYAGSDLLGNVYIEIFGSGRISVDGCLGVYEYKENYLKLRLIKGTLILYGSEFNIIYFENRLISIKGKISSVEFC